MKKMSNCCRGNSATSAAVTDWAALQAKYVPRPPSVRRGVAPIPFRQSTCRGCSVSGPPPSILPNCCFADARVDKSQHPLGGRGGTGSGADSVPVGCAILPLPNVNRLHDLTASAAMKLRPSLEPQRNLPEVPRRWRPNGPLLRCRPQARRWDRPGSHREKTKRAIRVNRRIGIARRPQNPGPENPAIEDETIRKSRLVR